MDKREYEKQLSCLQDKHREEINSLKCRYALFNNPYKKGDILQDHYHTIKVDKIVAHGLTIIFIGTELKKNLEPKKIQSNTDMWLSNVENKLNK